MMAEMRGKWASRFIWAAVLQGAILTVVTVLIVEPWTDLNISSYYSPSKVIVGGGGGTWMFTGYILYLVVGLVVAGDFHSLQTTPRTESATVNSSASILELRAILLVTGTTLPPLLSS